MCILYLFAIDNVQIAVFGSHTVKLNIKSQLRSYASYNSISNNEIDFSTAFYCNFGECGL